MRLLLVTNLFPDQSEPWRGLDNATLLDALRIERSDLNVHVLALRPRLLPGALRLKPRPVDEWTQPKYLAVPYVPKAGGMNHVLAALTLRRWATSHFNQTKDYDIILTPWLFPDACAVSWSAPLRRMRQLAIAQGSDVHRYLAMPMRRRANLGMASRVGGIVVRSQDLGSRLVKEGVQASLVSPVYNGVDTDCFKPGSKSDARVRLGLPLDRPLALFVGNFLPIKGIDLLIQSIAAIKEQGIELHLALIGSGPLEKNLRELAQRLGISGQLHWRGRVPPPEVAEHMRAADTVCLSSHNEGLPNVVLEALACGRPFVSTDVGGIHEVLRGENTPHALVAGREVCEYASALAHVLQRPADEKAIADFGRTFSWSNCARQHLHIMERLISSPTPNA